MTLWTRSWSRAHTIALTAGCLPTLVTAGGAAFAAWSPPSTKSSCRESLAPTLFGPFRSFASTLSSTPLACSAVSDPSTEHLRYKQTNADHYFRKHQEIPRPAVMHAKLPIQGQSLVEREGYKVTRQNILVIGDVHGCFDELVKLHEMAMKDHNDGVPFRFVILVGDLCNKGPHSTKVVRWARTTPNVYSIRGNHDDGALATALGDERRRKKRKYAWVAEGERAQGEWLQDIKFTTDIDSREIVGDKPWLSDADVDWLAELPYTLTIPGGFLDQERDVTIVHAGFIPEKPIEEQDINTMVSIREVVPICDCDNDSDSAPKITHFEYHTRVQKDKPAVPRETLNCNQPVPWASIWKGPQQVIFGHDARRGLQRYPGDNAIGLDTGACYGKQLTGMILPSEAVVSVESKEYSSIKVTTD